MSDDTRQQRRARERAEARAALQARVHEQVKRAVTVFDMWQTYRREVLHGITNPIQIEETRRGFYAGAAAMLDLMQRVSPDEVTEDEGVAMLEALAQELRAFNTDLRQV